MRRGNLFVISGPAGVGKGTLVARIMERLPDAWLSVSLTTRPARDDEVEGVHYFFVDDARFDAIIAENGFLEWAQVHGYKYGTPARLVNDHLSAGRQVILEIDCQGALQVRSRVPEAHLVFVEPPSLEELERRLRGRGTEDESSVALRMRNAKVELSHTKDFDVCFVNDRLDICVDELMSYIKQIVDTKGDMHEHHRPQS